MEGVQRSLLSGDKGTSYIVVDERRTDPFLVVTMTEGKATWRTGWCKTLSYVQRKIGELEAEGFMFDGSVDAERGDLELLELFRISRYDTSDLKSALQKLIRRGRAKEAVDVAYTLAAGELWWMAMRLPIIAVEDAGWDWLGVLPQKPITEQEALEIVYEMASIPKNQEAAALPWAARTPEGDDLEIEGEASMLLRMWETNQEGVETHLNKRLYEGVPEFTGRLVGKAMWRLSMPAMKDDQNMLIAGAVIGLHDRPSEFPFHLPFTEFSGESRSISTVSQASTAVSLPWWCFDGHSKIGRQVLKSLADAYGMETKRMGALWFAVESTQVDERRSTRWWEMSRDAWARSMGWPDFAHMEAEWSFIRSEAQRRVEEVLP